MAEGIELTMDSALPAAARWQGEGAAIAPLAPCARWSLRLRRDRAERLGSIAGLRIGMEINRGGFADGKLAARLGPDEWLLCAPLDVAQDFERLLTDALGEEQHSLVDVSHRYAALSVEGPHAPLLLASGCPLDLHPQVFGAGTATRTLLGKTEIILWRPGEAPVYRIECARSHGAYVTAFLREAARDFA